MSRPVIGVSCNYIPPEDRQFYKGKPLQYGEESMVRAIENAGGRAIFLPIPQDPNDVIDYVSLVDGVVLSGGTDVDPGAYNEALLDERWRGQPDRDTFEIALVHALREQPGKRLLGVCRGCQLLNVALGGSLWQDLVSGGGFEVHRSQELYDDLGHTIEVVPNTLLADLVGAGSKAVNSIHHQGVRRVAEALEVWATSPDGVIEAIGDPRDSDVLGVQWHPEWMTGDAGAEALFRWVTGV